MFFGVWFLHQTMMGYWLHDGYARVPGYYDYTVYSQYLGEGRDTFDTQPVVSSSGNVPCTLCVFPCGLYCRALAFSVSVCLCVHVSHGPSVASHL